MAVLAGVFVTALYSFRLYFLVFHGNERYDQNPDAHHGDHAHDHDPSHGGHAQGHTDKPQESSWVVTLPLILLAIPSVLVGYFTIDGLLYGNFFADAIVVDAVKHPVMVELAAGFNGAAAMAIHGLQLAPFWLALAGVVLAYYMYMVNPAVPAAFARMFAPIVTVMENKYYMDWFNENVLARGARLLGTGLWKSGDQGVIEGGVVNASWKLIGFISSLVRRAQSGFLYHYAFVMILGMFAMVTVFVWLA